MYFDELLTRLQKEGLPQVVLFTGESEGTMTDGYLALRDRFRKDEPAGELEVYDCKDVRSDGEGEEGGGLEEALAAARSAGLFTSARMIVLRNAGKALGGRSEKPFELLKDYFKDPDPGTKLVFLAPNMRKDAKAVKTVERLGWTVHCTDMFEAKVSGWVKTQAAAMGLTLTGDAAQLLADKVGADSSYLRRAIEQLSVYVLPGKSATAREVRELPSPGMESGDFDFLDAVGARQSDAAIRLLGRMADDINVGTVMVLYGRVRQLLSGAIWRKKGANQAQWASRNPMNPFMAKNIWDQSARFTPEELRTALAELVHIQAGVVTGRLGKTALPVRLEYWVLKWGKSRMAAVPGATR